MAKIYLVNVGANVSHESQARSPRFANGRFVYVSFPDEACRRRYAPEARRFVRDPDQMRTHIDPDWDHLTYGDACANPRARALLSVEPSDILLFWALLWQVTDEQADVWASTEKGWYLIGALRVDFILESGQMITRLPNSVQRRVVHNEHMRGRRVESRTHVRVFIGSPKYSARFALPVDLGIYKNYGLLRKTVRTANGEKVQWDRSPRWNSVTRTCRAVLDLSVAAELRRAEIINRSVQMFNPKCDFLRDVQ